MPAALAIPNPTLSPAYPGATRSQVRLGAGLSLPKGSVLAEYAASGDTYGPYDPAAGDGRAAARCVNMRDCCTDASGRVYLATLTPGQGALGDRPTDRADVYLTGVFRTQELVGLDAQAAAQLGRLVEGTTSQGLLSIG